MIRTKLTFFTLMAAGLLGTMCTNLSEECARTLSCGSDGASGGGSAIGGSTGNSGGNAAVSGGMSAGGSGGLIAGAPSIGGAAGTLPCGKLCDGAEPFCDVVHGKCVQCRGQLDCVTGLCEVGAGKCVECLSNETCVGPAAARCSNAGACATCTDNSQCAHIPGKNVCSAGACVACAAHSDCPLPDKAQCSAQSSSCTACTDDTQCAHIPGKNVCSAGACVQCTGTKAEACGFSGSDRLVCDSINKTCSTLRAGKTDVCQPCVSDAQCMPGRLCVQETLNSGQKLGFACFWKEGDPQVGAPANCFIDGRPFSKLLASASSIDGATANICTLRVSSCLAFKQFSNVICATTATIPMADDSKCGVVPGVDARCAEVQPEAFSCTMTCGSNKDCRFDCDMIPGICKFN